MENINNNENNNDDELQYVSFSQDISNIAVGTQSGFKIFSIYPTFSLKIAQSNIYI